MNKNSTREEILEVALDLFSVNGFEATSISQIADAVGIRKASLYSHFDSKQDILDAVTGIVTDAYEEGSFFDSAFWDDPDIPKGKKGMSAADAAKLVQDEVRRALRDPAVSRGRRMLVIEQFHNEELAELHARMSHDDILNYFEGMVNYLVRSGKFRKGDAEIMAAQLALPVSAWINLCDREPRREKEVMELIQRHVEQFFKAYGKQS